MDEIQHKWYLLQSKTQPEVQWQAALSRRLSPMPICYVGAETPDTLQALKGTERRNTSPPKDAPISSAGKDKEKWYTIVKVLSWVYLCKPESLGEMGWWAACGP